MKILKEKTEIAKAINFRKYTVIEVDVADADDFGLVSKPVLINNGTFKTGDPYLIRAKLRVYEDEKRFTFSANVVGISSGFGYQDMRDMLDYANAPVVEKDSDVLVCIIDTKARVTFAPVILHTDKRIDPHSSCPLSFIKEDQDATLFTDALGGRLPMFKRNTEE